ncbi:NUDIX domain-containing protein [Clostridium estertheticum]|uniref:NUDIX hydrolase n=1 Tax=Clostridium estertheticum TaxID=238834 RepID=UPI0013E96D7F|nr:NUDIX domain-containing protein [Clostridium estertheticum]MBZ9689322.1 NUDIX domain-containing protein [Clostridium estertheticum]
MAENVVNDDKKVFGEKLNGVNYIDRGGVYGIVINEEGKIATIKTPTGYFLPGGGIEKGETHKECLEREFIEETGYEVVIGRYIGKASLYHISKINQYLHGIGYFYVVNLKCKTSYKIEDDHELLWIEAGECVKGLFLKHQAWAVSEALRSKI